jgi:WD40 repeat protein
MPPPGVSPNIWRDCWLIRAQGSDGCSGRFVVAASAGNTMESGFCSWDFYTKEVKAFQIDGVANSRTALRPLPNNIRRNSTSTISSVDRQWWYKPCGPLVISTCSSQRGMQVFDVRDGEQVMRWEVQKPVVAMDYSSPLQWRNRGKVVVAEAESLSVWDVNSLSPQALVSIPFGGKKISALHVNNTDAELGGGVRKR